MDAGKVGLMGFPGRMAAALFMGMSLAACENPPANPAVREVEKTSPTLAREPGVAPGPAVPRTPLSRSNTYTDDLDADGIAETRTTDTWTYDPVARRCTQTTEIDFDADGTVDSRSVATTGESLAC
jgi:hypothetical protein